MKKILTIAVVLLYTYMSLSAQQDAEYSMYMFNGLYLNPAYAGSRDVISATALYRHQWVGIEGAPRSGSIAIHTPFKRDQYAIGGVFSFDKLGLNQTYSIYLDYAYKLRFKKGLRLSFGIQAGGQYYKNNLTEASINAADISFANNRNLFLPNVGFGVYLYNKKFYIGASVPHILNMSLSEKWSNAADRATVSRLYNHYLITAGLVIGKEEAKVKFKPSTLIKVVKGAPVSTDVTASFLFVNRFWLGVSYRFGAGKDISGKVKSRGNRIVGLAEFKVTPQLRIGYAYDYEFDVSRGYQRGTHEAMIGYEFGFEKTRFVTPRYVTYF
jgi:type IX secretion system PorP/SprF family membrane protein